VNTRNTPKVVNLDIQPHADDLPRTIVNCLSQLAQSRPDDLALVVAGQHGDVRFDYAGLDRRSRALAARLAQHFAPGERVLLLLENDEYYVQAFFACLYAGLIAVPVFPPESLKEQHLARLAVIAADSTAACILSTSAMIQSVGRAMDGLGVEVVWAVDDALEFDLGDWQPHQPAENEIAFLQYTSGSTASPKGVMVSHANLMANERAISERFAISSDDVIVSWLPLFHDMGLIGGLLQGFYRGILVVLMSPSYFMERPSRWLDAISRYGGTISGGPDFSFRLCFERIKKSQLTALDLSSWRVMFSGAEPVRHDTLADFTRYFAATGLSAKAAYPCYGLAEATLLVTGGQRGSGVVTQSFSRQALALGKAVPDVEGCIQVACGYPPSQHGVDIVDPEQWRILSEGEVGEIWAHGPSIAQGYWQKAQSSRDTFVVQQGLRWLRTGDLGFLWQGQLYITGRRKDLIILRGHNLYPQDIEQGLENAVDVIRKGRVAAFSVSGPQGEGIGIALEVSKSLQKMVSQEALLETLSEALSAFCHESMSVLLLLQPGSLPKTTSGKLQRSACRQGWLDRQLDAYACYEFGAWSWGDSAEKPAELPSGELEIALAEQWQSLLNQPVLDRQAHFIMSGGQSLSAALLVAKIREYWQLDYTVARLFAAPRFCQIAADIQRLNETGARICVDAIPRLRQALSPLSYGQQRQWFLWQLDQASSAYHICGGLHLQGQLDLPLLSQVFNTLIARHESLRTVFIPDDQQLVLQKVLPELQIEIHHASHLGLTGQEALAHPIIQAWQQAPFDLAAGPLLRLGVVQLSEQTQILVLVMHHIIADGGSMQILLDEWAQLYQSAGRASLPELPVQYADFAQWQRAYLAAGVAEQQLKYWQGALGKTHPVLLLQSDSPRKAGAYPAAEYRLEIPAQLAQSLRQSFAGKTLFTLLLTAFQALLYRYSGQADIRLGVPVANRNRSELAPLIGFFVNTQVLRCQIDGRMSLAELLAQAATRASEAQVHQDLPFEQLLDGLNIERSLGQQPLFQVMFNHLREDFRALKQVGGLHVSACDIPAQTAQFELTLETLEQPDGTIQTRWVYADGLFAASRIGQMAAHYLRVLEQLLALPEQAIADVDLLSESEREQQRAWGSNPQRFDASQPVHRLIEAQVAQRPDAIALIFGDIELSYAELNRRSNQLAHRLIAQGVAPEVKVGIALERSIEMVVALLAVLKAGGAYVPLDPDYPQDRLAYMVEDSGITHLLTQAAVQERIPHPAQVLVLDRLDLSALADSNPELELHGDNLAYVIYTSGSTGKPKGVAVEHGPLAMHISTIGQRYGMTPADRELQFASINFDGAHERWLVPLAFGAALMPRDNEIWDVQHTCEKISQHGITIACFTPSYLHQLAEIMGEKASALPIRSYTVGGEAMSRASFDLIQRVLKPPRIINGYGPTETVITPMIATMYAGDTFDAAYMPIGTLVGDRTAYVLDAHLNLLPQGVAGELYLGGLGLARGYLNRPELSAERFIADPFNPTGGRLYRTGDLVRWRADGQLEYLGRLDHQVKIRGFRIELGEVEAQLLTQDGVREAVVIAQQAASGMRLVGYVSLQAGSTLDAAQLKAELASHLPDYMVPSVLMILDQLPLNPNGKVDRKALPQPEFASAAYAAPQGELELALAQAWADVLGVERVGRSDHFFELGGHSLKAMELVALLQKRHGWSLPVRPFFEWPVLSDFVQQILLLQIAQPEKLSAIDHLLAEFEV
jgi:amino acid adenylation domain-containing protein